MRCGQCDEIFDAAANLQEMAASEQTLPPVQASAADVPAPATPSVEPVDFEGSENEPLPASLASVEDLDDVPLPLESADALIGATHGIPSAAEASAFDQGAPDTALLPESAQSPLFMREAREHDRTPPSRRRRWLSRLAAVVLALMLVMQWLVHERDRLAAAAPGLAPLLEAACTLAQCSLAPLRQIESVQIDSASFNKVRPDVYRLSLTLKNTATTDLALPAIELSLTDTQDQPLLRRVILAGELGLPSEVLVAGAESIVSLTLSVKPEGSAERFTGYRVLAFYP